MPDSKKLFCFGFGYTADYLAYALMQMPRKWHISGTTRDEHKLELLRSRGIDAHIFDDDTALIDPGFILKDVTHLLLSAPPNDEGDLAFLKHAADIEKMSKLEWVGYLSTTGVYGNREGRWVDETVEVAPTSKRGQKRLIAEQQWFSLMENAGLPVHIFRLSGIYGPGRSALDSMRAGIARRIHKNGHAFGRIHVEDIVNVIMKSIQSPQPGEIYNVTDDVPAQSHEVIEYAAKLLGMTAPPIVEFEDADLAPITRSFYMDNRRVSNAKIKRELEVELKYPDFKAGLRGCLDAENHTIETMRASESGAGGDNTPSVFKN